MEVLDSITIGIDFLCDDLFAEIKNDVLHNEFCSLENFINKFEQYADWNYTDELLERFKNLCRFLIDCHQYDYVTEIFKLSYIIAVYDDEKMGSECVINHAIRNMDVQDIVNMLKDVGLEGKTSNCFFSLITPSTVAQECNKQNIIDFLIEKEIE